MTGSYAASFYSAGIGIILSGLMILFIVGLSRRSQKQVTPPANEPVQNFVPEENGHVVLSATEDKNNPKFNIWYALMAFFHYLRL